MCRIWRESGNMNKTVTTRLRTREVSLDRGIDRRAAARHPLADRLLPEPTAHSVR
jgi:hypothetical protein